MRCSWLPQSCFIDRSQNTPKICEKPWLAPLPYICRFWPKTAKFLAFQAKPQWFWEIYSLKSRILGWILILSAGAGCEILGPRHEGLKLKRRLQVKLFWLQVLNNLTRFFVKVNCCIAKNLFWFLADFQNLKNSFLFYISNLLLGLGFEVCEMNLVFAKNLYRGKFLARYGDF